MDEQQLDRLIKALNDLTGNSTAKAKALQSELVALKAKQPFTAQERRQLIEKLSKAKELLKQDKEQVKTIETLIESQRDLVKANDDVVEGLRKVGNSFMGLGKAAFEGSGSISAFTDNVLGFQTLGNRLDVNIETFRQLSQTGANFGQSIVELRTAAANAALPLDDFASLVANNSQNLAALFGSTTQGARAIANLGRQTRELGIDRLAPLGFTVEEINETLLLNLDNQRRAGVLGQLTDTQRINSSIAFAEQLDRLAKLTGQQRDELRQQIEQQQANERFQAFLQGQTVETGNRLRAFAGTVAGISPQLAEGFQDLIANAGVPVTESALQLVQNIPGARDVINDLISGVISSEQALIRIRDISAGSIDRFRQATVTGQVEFLSLQGGIIELGRRVTDAGAVLDEQNKQATSLVSNLTTFEQASKVLSSQFQSIETGLLQAFGPALGRLIGGVQEIFTGGGRIATFLKESPALTAGLFAGALTGKFLFDKAAQIGIITAGTAAGFRIAQGGLAAAGGIAKGGLRTGVGAIGGLGLAAAGTGVAATAESNAEKAMGLAMAAGGGALTGATIGSVIPGIGTLVGGIIGGALGTISGVTGMMGNRQFGGNMDAGQSYLVGEAGPEIVRAGTASTVVANQDLQSTFNTEALETKMTQLVSEMSNANKTLTNMVNGVNTLVAVEGRALKAVERTARKDVNQIGIV